MIQIFSDFISELIFYIDTNLSFFEQSALLILEIFLIFFLLLGTIKSLKKLFTEVQDLRKIIKIKKEIIEKHLH